MLLISGSIILGIIMGIRLNKHENLAKISTFAANVLIVLMVLIMGFNLGANEVLVENLASIGTYSLLLAVSCSFGSLLFVHFLDIVAKEGDN